MSAIPDRLASLFAPGTTSRQLAELFAEAGEELYLVGGSVRDALLDRGAKDLDFATRARPDGIESIVGTWASDLYTAGKTFGTIGVVKEGRIHEITTFRSEVYRDESRKPTVTYSDSIDDDLARRDFTINAMAIRVPPDDGFEPRMIDPHDGLADLGRSLMRTPLGPDVSFGDDPLRMLRLFRFVSTLGFTAAPAAYGAVVEMRRRLEIVSAERIRDELDKLLVGDNVAEALRGLIDTGLADQFIPEVAGLALEQDPVHRHKDVLAHSIAVVARVSPRLELRAAALFHDIGKPATRDYGPGGVSFHHHEVVGARLTRERMRKLRYPKTVVGDVSQLVFLHMRPHTYKMGWSDAAVRRYVRDAGPLLDDLNELVRCDATTRNQKRFRAIARRIDELEARIRELREQEELDRLRPPIDGRQVMAYLGLESGPTVGVVMDMLYERRIEQGPYDEAEAYRMLDEWREAHA